MQSEGPLDGRVIGEIGVAMAVERLLRAGYQVARPVVDEGYDLIVFANRLHWRVQVKATASTHARHCRRIRITRGRRRRGEYAASHVDAFVAVNVRTGTVMCVPVSAAKGRHHLNWSDAHRWSDFGVMRRIRTKRC